MSDGHLKKFEETRPPGVKPPTRMTCMAGQMICEQGAPANQAFYIESGLVEVVIEDEGHTIKLAEIGPGEVFGEMGVLEHELRSATVRALETSKITVMAHEELMKRIEQVNDPVIHALINGLTKRLRATSEGHVKYFKNLANFQSRVSGIMSKANAGIAQDKRDEFAEEIAPLLDKIEHLLEKYRE